MCVCVFVFVFVCVCMYICILYSVSIRVQKEDVYLCPDLEFLDVTHFIIYHSPRNMDVLTFVTDVKTAVWTLTETLYMQFHA